MNQITNIQQALENNLSDIQKAVSLTIRDFTATLEQINHLIQQAPQTKYLSLVHQNIKTLPNFSSLTNLVNLDLTCQSLESLPKEFWPPNIDILKMKYYRS